MRWFVEISSLGQGPGLKSTLCVEAPQWQPALQKARAIRGDDAALTNFSIELLDDGFRAIDPQKRLRYVVRRAPDDAALTDPEKANGATSGQDKAASSKPGEAPSSKDAKAASSKPNGPAKVDAKKPAAAGPPRPEPTSAKAPASDAKPTSSDKADSAKVVEADRRTSRKSTGGEPKSRISIPLDKPPPPPAQAKVETPKPSPTAAVAPAAPAVVIKDVPPPPPSRPSPGAKDTMLDGAVGHKILRQRENEPSDKSPLTYRELAIAVAEGTSEAAAGRLIVERFESLRESLASARAGKLVNLAVFDHEFTAKPLRRPIVTLTWKDWKGDPEIRYPLRDGGGETPTPLATSAQTQALPAKAAIPSAPPAPAKPDAAAVAASVAAEKPASIPPPPKPASIPPPPAAPAPVVAAAPAAPPPAPPAPVEEDEEDIPVEIEAVTATPEPAAAPPPAPPAPVDARSRGSFDAVAPPAAPSSQPVVAAPATPAPSSQPVAAPVSPISPAPAAPAPSSQPATPVVAPLAPASQPKPATPVIIPAATEEPSVPIPLVASAPAPAPASAPPPSTPVVQPAPQASRAPAPPPPPPAKPGKRRLSGDDLLVELFEACSDLHFLSESLSGADFILNLTLEKLPSEVGVVSLFDINRREFVVVRQVGGSRSALCQRVSEKTPLIIKAMRSQRALVIPDTSTSMDGAPDDRWATIGVAPRSLICTPVALGGRYLGLIEIANPLDGGAYTDGDGHALTYIGQQFGEFVAAQGVIIDPDFILQHAQRPR